MAFEKDRSRADPFAFSKSHEQPTPATKNDTILNYSNTATSGKKNDASQNQRKRNKVFEDALLKWQGLGNDIIERKQPNYLILPGKEGKGNKSKETRVTSTKMAPQLGPSKKVDKDELEKKAKGEYEEEIRKLAARIMEEVWDFKDMQKRSVKIENGLKELKQQSQAMLS